MIMRLFVQSIQTKKLKMLLDQSQLFTQITMLMKYFVTKEIR